MPLRMSHVLPKPPAEMRSIIGYEVFRREVYRQPGDH
jgi:hypothetical protein